jgi:diaminohydroxyphosphoribosylaminopyrimidine deaminase/5-amino-6-(5-phosphoribosylamino)uracil reductase
MNDRKIMHEVLQIARAGEGFTAPNPMVGAVIIKNDRIIGKGAHRKYGEKHAEINAIENAVESVEGATLYTNLEPCCHSTPGKNTPPCTNRIIREKIFRVVISTIDPNPHVSGNGIRTLREAGIEVITDVLPEEAVRLNEVYFKFIQTNQPFVHLKIAQSIDGRIATHNYDSQWITDESARTQVHKMRHKYSAVLIGLNTLKKDNPNLTVRLTQGKQPFRIILDERLEAPLPSNVFQDAYASKTIVFTTPDYDKYKREELALQGISVNPVQSNGNGLVDLHEVLSQVAQSGISSILVEGGGMVFTQFIANKLFDKISVYISPIIIGSGIESIGDLNINKISEALNLENVNFENVNHQLVVTGYRDISATFGKMAEYL